MESQDTGTPHGLLVEVLKDWIERFSILN